MLYGMFLRMLHGEEQLNEDVFCWKRWLRSVFFRLLLPADSLNWNIFEHFYAKKVMVLHEQKF